MMNIFMVALCYRAGHYIFALWFLLSSSSFFFFSPNLSRRRLDVYHTSTHSANLGCRSETCCTRLAEKYMTQRSPKICHLGTIAQFCWAISLQLRHVSTIGKKLVKQQCLPHMFSQYGELRPTSSSDRFDCLGHPT